MKQRMFFAAIMAMFFVSQVSIVMAEEEAGLKVSGFVDASYSYANDEDDQADFSLDQIEVDLEKEIKGVGLLRADINFGSYTDKLSTDDVLEQGYMTIDQGLPVSLMFGKFNAPIGFELLDAPDMYQFSHAMVFDNGLPTNLTGINFVGEFGMIDFNAYVVNGWDQITDDNKDKTIGGRLGVTPVEGLNIGLSYITGREGKDIKAGTSYQVVADDVDEDGKPDEPVTWSLKPNEASEAKNLSVFDVDITFTGIPNLTIGAEYNSGIHEDSSAIATNSGEDATWNGYLLMVHYDFIEWAGLTLRYDVFNDTEGSRFENKLDETRSSFTFAPTFAIGDGFGALIEYKSTTSNQDTFTDKDGNSKSDESSLALEFTYTF